MALDSINIHRSPGESDLQYIWRVCSLKDYGAINFTWNQLADVLNHELIDDESEYLGESAYRKKYQQAKAFYEEVFSKMHSDDHYNQIESQRIELQKERYKLYDQRNAYNKMLRSQARQEELIEIIKNAIQNSELPSLPYYPNSRSSSDNDLLVSLNDIHFGAVVDNYWRKYDSTICTKMMEHYIGRIIDIAETHNSENCIVWANGDLISGNIHHSIAVTNKENVIEQLFGVSELIANFISELSKHFKNVKFVSVAGNHSRIDPNKDRALIGERLDDLVEWYLKARLQTFENVEIGFGEKIDHTMYLIDVRGKKYCGIHGDFDGNPNTIQSLQSMAGCKLYAILSGHLHHCKTDNVQGVKTVMAGSFLGMDDHCVSKRIIGNPEQMVCVCNNDGILCNYNIDLSMI